MPVYFLAAARTPIGAFGRSLKAVAAPILAARATEETILRAGIDPSLIQETILGCAFPGGCGENPAWLAACEARLDGPAFTVSMGSGSGLKAISLAAQHCAGNAHALVLAGGTENCSRVPFWAPEARWGRRIGATMMQDSLLVDGPYKPLDGLAEPSEAELAWVTSSTAKAKATRTLRERECFPLSWAGQRGPGSLTADEAPQESRMAFPPQIAAPADGAAMVLVGTSPGPAPMGRLLGVVETTQGCSAAIRRLLAQTGLSMAAVDRWELHESSAAWMLEVLGELPELDPGKVNVRGGALALGDPCGASGARMLVSLLHTLQDENLEIGIVALPAGPGLALAMAIARF